MFDINGENNRNKTPCENFGASIAKLRVEKGMTQASFAQRLGVTHQAVSQWECGDTMPDIALLPKLSALLCVTLDSLFGLETQDRAENQRAPDLSPDNCPQDDGKLRAVVFIGNKMVKSQQAAQKLISENRIVFEYRGPALNVESHMALQCGDVGGNAASGHAMKCGNINGNAAAGHAMSCGNVGQNANAGHSLNVSGDIGGSANAGHGMSCGNVNGNVKAGHSVKVNGSVVGEISSRG